MQDERFRELVNNYFLHLNINITGFDINTKDFDPSDLPDNMPDGTRNMLLEELKGKMSFTVFARHQVYNEQGLPPQLAQAW